MGKLYSVSVSLSISLLFCETLLYITLFHQIGSIQKTKGTKVQHKQIQEITECRSEWFTLMKRVDNLNVTCTVWLDYYRVSRKAVMLRRAQIVLKPAYFVNSCVLVSL